MDRKYIFLVRHGSTLHNESGIIHGKSEDAISQKGREQSLCLAQFLKKFNIKSICSSGLRRAVETSEIVSQELGVNFSIAHELRERDYGRFDGMNREQLLYERKRIGLDNNDPTQDWYGTFMSEVESDEDIWNRVWPVLECGLEVIQEGEVAVFVSHAGVIKATLHSAFEIPKDKTNSFKVRNCSVVILSYLKENIMMHGLYSDPCFILGKDY